MADTSTSNPSSTAASSGAPGRAQLGDLVAIARPDHWFKNVFMLPGAALALIFTDDAFAPELVNLLLGVVSTCLLASANYTINEWWDAEFDRHHPVKKFRPSASGRVSAAAVYAQWAVLVIVGTTIAAAISTNFLLFSCVFLAMGLIYNVKPSRTKDRQSSTARGRSCCTWSLSAA